MSNGSISKFRRTAIKLLSSLAEGQARAKSRTVFQVREQFLDSQCQAAYKAIVEAGDGKILVFPKVHLVDFLFVHDGTSQINDAVRMDRKNVDFLLCDAETMQPRAVVELFSSDRKRGYKSCQDPFVSRALNSSGLASFRIEARDSYPIDELRERLIRRLTITSDATDAEAPVSEPTNQPKTRIDAPRKASKKVTR